MNIAVYCSSSNHIAEHYKQSAYQLGEWMAENGHTLIFGGATGGLMSSISEGVSSKKGKIIGKGNSCVRKAMNVKTGVIAAAK